MRERKTLRKPVAGRAKMPRTSRRFFCVSDKSRTGSAL
jgi:hypothetical protein